MEDTKHTGVKEHVLLDKDKLKAASEQEQPTDTDTRIIVQIQSEKTDATNPSKPKKLDPTITVALINAVPKIVAVLALLILLWFYRDAIKNLVPRISQAKVLGVEIALEPLKEELLKQPGNQGTEKISVKPEEALSALRRAERVLPVFKDANILWVDDHPENNLSLRRVLTALGAKVTVALSSGEAIDFLRRSDFDLIITDRTRDKESDSSRAGIHMLEEIRRMGFDQEAIFYTGQLEDCLPNSKCVPDLAFAITTRPDELLNYVTDALERKRWGEEGPHASDQTTLG